MIEEIPGPDPKTVLQRIHAAGALPSGSKKQRAALHAIWVSLTDAQRRKMVEDDSDFSADGMGDDDDDDDEDDGKGASSSCTKGGGKQGASKAKAALPPPAQRTCPRGHSLTPVNSKPDDYRKLQGNEGNCDLCDKDYKCDAHTLAHAHVACRQQRPPSHLPMLKHILTLALALQVHCRWLSLQCM